MQWLVKGFSAIISALLKSAPYLLFRVYFTGRGAICLMNKNNPAPLTSDAGFALSIHIFTHTITHDLNRNFQKSSQVFIPSH